MAEGLRPQADQHMNQGQNFSNASEVLSGTIDSSSRPMVDVQQVMMKNRRMILFVAASMLFVGFIALMLWSSETPYRTVYSGMDEKDAAAIVELLQKEKIPYKLQGGGTVLVPENEIYNVRLKLAGENLLPGNGEGYELFDRSHEFGISDFTQKINLQRAMQVELSRTIEVLPLVAAARVHLVLPKASAFAERERKASASVMLKLTGNKKLSQQTVNAIQNLVASAVPELAPDAVTVVDASGNLLSLAEGHQPTGEGQGMMDYQSKLERGYEARLTSMLEQVVGAGQAVVRVTANINREFVESHAKIYNPDEQVLRSSKRIDEQRKTVDATPMGVPGMASNSPDNIVSADGSVVTQEGPSEQATRNENVMNYEISSKTEHRVVPFGTLEKLSIAVIVGDVVSTNEAGEIVHTPRTAENLKTLEALVASAVGLNEDRGDTIEIKSMPLMDLSGSSDAAMDNMVDKALYFDIARYGLATLVLLLLAWFVLRPMAKRIQTIETRDHDIVPSDMQGYVAGDMESEHVQQMVKARQAVLDNPDRASRVVNEWVSSA
jgi:flagellar M-ring protein FliF